METKKISCTNCDRHDLNDNKCLHAKTKINEIYQKKYNLTADSNHNEIFYDFCLNKVKP